MRIRTVVVIVSAWAWLVGGGGVVVAQESALRIAEKHFDRAQRLFEDNRYEAAAEAFRKAYKARPLAPFLYNIGASYEKLAKQKPARIDNWNRAIEYYNRYLKKAPEAPDRALVAERIQILKAERDRIQADLAGASDSPAEIATSSQVQALEEAQIRGLVIIESDPPGAYIYLDDKSKGPVSQTPWSGSLEGDRTVYIEHQGYKPREMAISPSPDKLLVLSFALAEEGYLGWIDITANVPGAAVYIDDKSFGVYRRTPFSGNITPGKHKIWITAEGYNEYYREIEIVAGKAHSVNARLKGAPVGYLKVHGRDIEMATIYVDGEVLCERGPCRKPVAEGVHEVTIAREGYKPYRREIRIQAKTEVLLRTKLVAIPGRSDAVWAYIFTAAMAGGGVYLGLESERIRDQLRGEIDAGILPPDSADPRFQRGQLFAIGSDAAYVLAGLTLATAVYYTFRDKGAPSMGTTDVRTVAVQPQLGPGYAGVGMGVSW